MISPAIRGNTAKNLPTLSVCVPTYKRRRQLQECIESILASASRCGPRIELVVSDNASPDDTWGYLSALREKHPNIVTVRQDTNIGAEGNIYSLIERARGDWLWVIGDDDRLEIDAVGQVLSLLDEAPPAVVVNYSVWSADFGRLIKREKFSTHLPQRWETSDELLQEFGIETGYCSALVFRKDNFLSAGRERYDAFSPFGFALLYAFYAGARNSSGFRFLRTPVVMNRSSNSTGFDWYKYFVRGTTMVLDQLGREGYSDRAVASAKSSVIRHFVLRDILVRKRDGADTSKIFQVTLEAYRSFALFWFGILPTLATPAWSVQWAYQVLKASRKVRRPLWAARKPSPPL